MYCIKYCYSNLGAIYAKGLSDYNMLFFFYLWLFPSYYFSFVLINVLHPDDPISVFYAVRRITVNVRV